MCKKYSSNNKPNKKSAWVSLYFEIVHWASGDRSAGPINWEGDN